MNPYRNDPSHWKPPRFRNPVPPILRTLTLMFYGLMYNIPTFFLQGSVFMVGVMIVMAVLLYFLVV